MVAHCKETWVNNGREQPQQILPEIIANFGDAG
jgi:hypothetical protein